MAVHLAPPSHYPDTEWQRCSLHFPFRTQEQNASHFGHDESAVIHAANGLSSHCLINKHRDPGEHPRILITLWPWRRVAIALRLKTEPFSAFPAFPITVKWNKSNPCAFLIFENCFWLLRQSSWGKNAEAGIWSKNKHGSGSGSGTAGLVMSRQLWRGQARSDATANFGRGSPRSERRRRREKWRGERRCHHSRQSGERATRARRWKATRRASLHTDARPRG